MASLHLASSSVSMHDYNFHAASRCYLDGLFFTHRKVDAAGTGDEGWRVGGWGEGDSRGCREGRCACHASERRKMSFVGVSHKDEGQAVRKATEGV